MKRPPLKDLREQFNLKMTKININDDWGL